MKCKDGVEIQSGIPCPICGAEPNQECRGRAYAAWLADRARQDEADAHRKALEEMRRILRDIDRDRRVAG